MPPKVSRALAIAVAQSQQIHKFLGIGKYSATSLIATGLDFLLFIVLIHFTIVSAITATAIGRLAGAILTLLLHRYWVFSHRSRRGWRKLLLQYFLGNILGVLLNMVGVWFFFQKIGIQPIVARAITALITWYFLYVFYKYFVYNKKNI